MYIDKNKAKKRKRRIPEKTLFAIACIGGSVGGILGMHMFRHKTKHLNFKYGFPIILIIQIVIVYAFVLLK